MILPATTRIDAGPRRTVLANGLTVLSEQVPGVRSVALGAWVRAGSIHETRERMGVSHLLEHMVFKGTRRRTAKEIALSLEVLGGSLDAYTTREHTAYQARVLDEHLPQAADVLADLVLHPLLRSDDLKLERKVVLEEISTVDDTPDDLVFELHGEAMWGEHPYGYSILGTRETVSSLGVRELKELHGGAYHPLNMVVAAAGNVDHDRLVDVLERAGWAEAPSTPLVPAPTREPVTLPPTARHVERDCAQTHIVFGSATVPFRDPRRHTLGLIDTVLGSGMSSRLFQRVREELGLAYSVYSFQHFNRDSGSLGVYVGTGPETAAQATDVIREELARLARESLSAEELAQGKGQLKGQITLSLEGVSSRMYRAVGIELYGEEFRPLDQVLADVEAITAEDVAAACAEFYAPERQTVLSLGPA